MPDHRIGEPPPSYSFPGCQAVLSESASDGMIIIRNFSSGVNRYKWGVQRGTPQDDVVSQET